MKHITVGIFHDPNLGKELGKKGKESDILMFNRKTDKYVFSFMSPVEEKLTTKTQIISTIDAAIISCKQINPEIGETILLLDSVGLSNGIIVVPKYTDTTQLTNLINGTSLQNYTIIDENIPKIIQLLEAFNIQRDTSKPTKIIIDHSFSVKGVGEVILGIVKQGTLHKYDKMRLLPINKEVLIRSIQMQDNDFEEATAGCRVGLAIKGATAEEMKRGSIITSPDGTTTDTTFKLKFTKNRYYPKINKGIFHLTVGMQSVPITILEIKENSITIKTEKPVSYTKDDDFIILDLNAKKLHHIGNGRLT